MQSCNTAKTALIAATLVSACIGCKGSDDPALYPAGGVVNYQSRPLAGAKVTFIPESKGGIAMATTDSQGRFTLKTGADPGVAAGQCNVTVTMMESGVEGGLSKSMTPEQMQQMQMEGKLQAELEKQEKSLIPKKYARADTSGLSYEIKSTGENKFTIDLTD